MRQTSTAPLQAVPGPVDKEEPGPAPPLTALVWNSEKYDGTPLQLDDTRLGELADWVKDHNITVVKLDSR